LFQCLNVFAYRELIWHKAWADFQSSAARTYLGVVWWVLDPLINMGVYYLVFGVFMGQRREGFVPFLLVGIVMWRFFEAGMKQGSRAILSSSGLVTQVAFHKVIFTLSSLLTQTIQMFFSLIPLVLVLVIYGVELSPQMLLFPVVMLVQMLLIMGLAMPMAALLPMAPDLGNLQDNFLRLLFYFSGIFYTITQVPVNIQPFFWANPMAWIIHAQRQCLLDGETPDFQGLGVIVAFSLVGIYVGALLTWKLDQVYGKRMV
jgi:lipopolysaccharide transport system permease protein